MKHWLIKNRQDQFEVILSPQMPRGAILPVPEDLHWKKVKLETYNDTEERQVIDPETGEPRLDGEGNPLTELVDVERQRVVLDEEAQAVEDQKRSEEQSRQAQAETARADLKQTISKGRNLEERVNALIKYLGLEDE